MHVRSPRWSADPDRFELAARRAIESRPAIWRVFVEEMLSQSTEVGRRRLSAKRAMEDTRARLKFTVDNSLTADIARAFIRTYPELGQYVETRARPVKAAA